MSRSLAFLAALLFAAISVSSACIAGTSMPNVLALKADRGDDQFSLPGNDGAPRNNLASSLTPSGLIGLDFAALSTPAQLVGFTIAGLE